ncbi:uncharacterized protein DFL_001140 [Arthrobotrys flagrans]|uniref:RRM domain-containing protein n=1 Tax=Arthrobotrys flagrans TaxID=97331 RepID=A0A437AGA1_ARTFL|nr:hypothetical protein DFL_001140 [Arthrobotrys flagrans]
MAESTTHRPRTRAPRTRVRKRDRAVKNLPETDNPEGETQEGNEGEEEYISIGGKDTTNEGLAKSLKRKRESNGDNGDVTMEDAGDTEKPKGNKQKMKDGDEGKTQQVHNEAYSNLLKTAKNKKRKERRKNAAAKAKAGGDAEGGSGEVNAGDGDVPVAEKEGNGDAVKDGGRKDHRFIVFVGNLPYTTTQATLTAHLSAVKPTGIRLATFKPGEKPKDRGYKPKKPTSEGPREPETICKGYAFVEFPDAGRMKSCLNLFHHSEFEGRKINVELTAGGGGKSSDRKERVKAKNESLNVERKKRYEEDRKKKIERGEKVEEEKVEEEVDDGIHPSRRKRVRR